MKTGLIVALVLVVGGSAAYIYTNNQKPEVVTRLSGIINYQKSLQFYIPVRINGNVDHFIDLSFSNESEAIKALSIDISKLPSESKDEFCSISGDSVAEIEVSGYNPVKADQDRSGTAKFVSVITPSSSKVVCAQP